MTTETLHCYTDDSDTVIAASPEDAIRVMDEYGVEGLDPEAFGVIDDATDLTIWCDPDGNPAPPDDDDTEPVTKSAAEWTRRGRGFLCTTEY